MLIAGKNFLHKSFPISCVCFGAKSVSVCVCVCVCMCVSPISVRV